MLFCKMNGLGNDYIFIDSSNANKSDINYILANKDGIITKLSDRHFGIGGDGVVVVESSVSSDVKMRIFNADGSEGRMCGNALRCIGKMLYDKSGGKRDEFSVETLSGEKNLKIISSKGNTAEIYTDIGKPKFIEVRDDVEYIDLGNRHAVFYVDRLDDNAIKKASTLSLKHDLNAEAVKVGGSGLSMRVWERGSGETLACGTGASAVAFSAYNRGLFTKEINIKLKGGNLTAFYDKGTVSLLGKATLNYIGELNLDYYGKNQ